MNTVLHQDVAHGLDITITSRDTALDRTGASRLICEVRFHQHGQLRHTLHQQMPRMRDRLPNWQEWSAQPLLTRVHDVATGLALAGFTLFLAASALIASMHIHSHLNPDAGEIPDFTLLRHMITVLLYSACVVIPGVTAAKLLEKHARTLRVFSWTETDAGHLARLAAEARSVAAGIVRSDRACAERAAQARGQARELGLVQTAA